MFQSERLRRVQKFLGEELGAEAQCLGLNKEVHSSPVATLLVASLIFVPPKSSIDNNTALHRVGSVPSPR